MSLCPPRRSVAAPLAAVLLASASLAPGIARAATYRVGPGETYRQLSDLPALAPSDVVEVLGGADYTGGVIFDFDSDGTAAMPITIRGIPDASGARPRIVGGTNTLEFQGDHYVVENLDVSGGTFRCIFHHADDITIRDTVVHDCAQHGILGADNDSGSLTLERVEVHHCGGGTQDHQIYMATDEIAHPGSVFRMQFCWVHDANGGNNVKSRAERNEIYFNWIEGGYYHELELIGPDGADETLAREDSDVVGNVLVKRGANENFAVVRFGGDGTGQTHGRYRFAFNTVIVAPGATAAVFRLFDGLASVEMHSNVFVARGGGPVNLLREVEAAWAGGSRLVAGSNNWVSTGSTNVPSEWTGTITGSDPGLVDVNTLSALDPAPASDTSPVVDAGFAPPAVFAASPFPAPLDTPGYSPVHGVGSVTRPVVAAIDIGAYERGSGPPPADAGPADTDGGGMASIDGGGMAGTDGGGMAGIDGGGMAGTDGGGTMGTDGGGTMGTDGGGTMGTDGGGSAGTDGGTAPAPAQSACGCRVAGMSTRASWLASSLGGLALALGGLRRLRTRQARERRSRRDLVRTADGGGGACG